MCGNPSPDILLSLDRTLGVVISNSVLRLSMFLTPYTGVGNLRKRPWRLPLPFVAHLFIHDRA